MKVLSQAPHALGMVLKKGRSQRPGKVKGQLYSNSKTMLDGGEL